MEQLNVSQLIQKLCELAGLGTDSQEFKDLASNADLTKIKVPDPIRSGILSGLMTMESAKSNFELGNHFKAQALNAVDQKIGAIATALGFSPEVIQKLQDEKNTYGKLDFIAQSGKSVIEEAKGSGGGQGKEKEAIEKLNGEIKTLHDQLAAQKQGYEEQLQSRAAEMEAERLDMDITAYLATKEFPAEALKFVSKETLYAEAKAKILERITASGGKLIRKDGKPRLVQSANPEAALFIENAEADFYKLSDKALAEAKLVGVNNQKNQGGGTPPGGGGHYSQAGGGGGNQDPIKADPQAGARIGSQLEALDAN